MQGGGRASRAEIQRQSMGPSTTGDQNQLFGKVWGAGIKQHAGSKAQNGGGRGEPAGQGGREVSSRKTSPSQMRKIVLAY